MNLASFHMGGPICSSIIADLSSIKRPASLGYSRFLLHTPC